MTHPDQDIIDFLTKDLDLRAAPDWMIERARAFRDGGGWLPIETAPRDEQPKLGFGIWQGEIAGIIDEPVIDIITKPDARPDRGHDMGEWWYCSTGDAYACWLLATHWKPFPTPPKDQNQ